MFSLICLSLSLLALSCSFDQQLPPLTYSGTEPRVQDPLSPEASMQHIQVPEDFSVSLFAAEPNIINPIAMAWDERGRLWVVQSQDYPHGLDNDVGGDRITICEDTNGDGRADQFTDFATDQSLTTGIVIVKGGAIVAQAPDLVFLQDTDGDDQADESETLFGGFGTWDTHAGPANLKYGIDNMIWGSVGYSGFENTFQGKPVEFSMGVYRFSRDGRYFEPVGQFNNNTWGLGWNEDFEIFGSTANNNHACYVGIPLRHYDYLHKRPKWAINADFIQGHYEITPVDTMPLQQVDVRGGYTAAAGANFYTAGNYPDRYRNQMYVNAPTGHLVHLARMEHDGAGYKEVDGGNIFASTDAWTAPVYTETGPDGNLWVADWYNPVVQHNPDHRGMDNQIWNNNKGEGNAHLNELRDKKHGRIYIVKYKGKEDDSIASLSAEDDEALLAALQHDNLFWRSTAQRLIVEHDKKELIPQLMELAAKEVAGKAFAKLHTLYTLDGLGAFAGGSHEDLVQEALVDDAYGVRRAALALLPATETGSDMLAASGLLESDNSQLRLAALLRASEMPETSALFQAVEKAISNPQNQDDKWLSAAGKIYKKAPNLEEADPATVRMLAQTGDGESPVQWKYTEEKPGDDWFSESYNDKSWKKGTAIFAKPDMELMKTPWNGSDIWLRRNFYLKSIPAEPVLKVMHDDNYEVYLNGQLLFAEAGSSRPYKHIKLNEEQKQLLQKGKNTLAVYCHDNGWNRYIDVGIGEIPKPKVDVVFNLNTVSQKMAYDKTQLRAKAGQTVRLRLNNGDEMPHNLVVIRPGSLATFGKMVDDFTRHPDAEKMGYVPNSRNLLAATAMLQPGESEEIIFTLPNEPGRYPFVCTFPAHWQTMNGEILVTAPGTILNADPASPQLAIMGGGGSHQFLEHFGKMDGRQLSQVNNTSVLYTEDVDQLHRMLPHLNLLYLCNNKPFPKATQEAILSSAREGLPMLIYHPSTWYNWKDWPQYNQELVGGGSRSHEKFQEFIVEVLQPNHPIMAGVPTTFRIVDELYRWEQDPGGTPIEVLAVGRSLETGKEYPVVWTVQHPNTRIVANTLGHDEKAHGLKAYQLILRNGLQWLLEGEKPS